MSNLRSLGNILYISEQLSNFGIGSLKWIRGDVLPDQQLELGLKIAPNYHVWKIRAEELDRMRKFKTWKHESKSKLYDYKLISSRLSSLKNAMNGNDVPTLKLLIRSGLLRNLGNLCDVRLFEQSKIGTKIIIEEYLEQVAATVQFLGAFDEPLQSKHDLFSDVSQSFGNTALLLNGGATFGLYHLGVCKALFDADLLPKIISGSAVGALIAALICSREAELLPKLFEPGGIDLAAFSSKSTGSIRRKVVRLLTEGYLLDVKVLQDCVKSNLGDITFEEAYKKSKRVLNITVLSTRQHEIPSVLNHLTAPNVLVRSAACASASMVGLYSSVDMFAKDNKGNIFVWSPSSTKWGKSFKPPEAPEQRLAELFNVNHFILSQSQPYIVPFIQGPNIGSNSIISKVFTFTGSEIRFRVAQLSRMGLAPNFISALFEEKLHGHITISPPLSHTDFATIFGNPTSESLEYWILKGQQSTWPFLGIIRNRTLIERALNSVKQQLADELDEKRIKSGGARGSNKKRTQSIG